jgi:hypothetical protein
MSGIQLGLIVALLVVAYVVVCPHSLIHAEGGGSSHCECSSYTTQPEWLRPAGQLKHFMYKFINVGPNSVTMRGEAPHTR